MFDSATGHRIRQNVISPASWIGALESICRGAPSAEILEAKAFAEAALHYAKVAKAANETHADCLRIITRAEMRMANEIDRGQAGGEVATPGRVNARSQGISTFDKLGLDSRRVSEWREVPDAGEEVVEGAIRACRGPRAGGKEMSKLRTFLRSMSSALTQAVTMKTDIPETAIHTSYLPWLAKVDALSAAQAWPREVIKRCKT